MHTVVSWQIHGHLVQAASGLCVLVCFVSGVCLFVLVVGFPYVTQADLELEVDSPASDSQVLGSQACTTCPAALCPELTIKFNPLAPSPIFASALGYCP